MDIGKQIDKLLSRHKITRLKLSKDTGIPYTTLTQIINGRTKNPQIKALETIADYFQVSINYLLGKSIYALIEERLNELNMTVPQLEKDMEYPQGMIESLDTLPPMPHDYEKGELIDKLSKTLKMDPKLLATAFARQEPPVYEGSTLTPLEAFRELEKDFGQEDIGTVAAHHDGEDWTEEELEEIERFKEFVRSKRKGE
jgi:transcriptional regulator with XRE-family HTH domain